MRTTVTLADDVVAAIEARRRETGEGLSEALNELARIGLTGASAPTRPFVQRTSSMGARVNLDNVGELLELADDAETATK